MHKEPKQKFWTICDLDNTRLRNRSEFFLHVRRSAITFFLKPANCVFSFFSVLCVFNPAAWSFFYQSANHNRPLWFIFSLSWFSSFLTIFCFGFQIPSFVIVRRFLSFQSPASVLPHMFVYWSLYTFPRKKKKLKLFVKEKQVTNITV